MDVMIQSVKGQFHNVKYKRFILWVTELDCKGQKNIFVPLFLSNNHAKYASNRKNLPFPKKSKALFQHGFAATSN